MSKIFFVTFACIIMENKEDNELTIPSYRKSLEPQRAEVLFNAIVKQLKKSNHYRNSEYTMEHLAKDLNVKRKYITASVLNCTGENYKALINQMRMRDVKRMMRTEKCQHMTIEDIALLAGYTSRQSFYTTFQRIFGTSPAAYRKLLPNSDTEAETSSPEVRALSN